MSFGERATGRQDAIAEKGGTGVSQPLTDRLWVNEARTTLVRLWSDGTVEVATRDTPAHTWGPPVYLTEEATSSPGNSQGQLTKETESSAL